MNKMPILENMDMVIEMDSKSLSGCKNVIGKIVKNSDKLELTAVTSEYKTTYRLGSKRSHHLDEIVTKLERRGFEDVAGLIKKKKNKKLRKDKMVV